MIRSLVIGERFNRPPRGYTSEQSRSIDFLIGVGAFPSGQSRERLEDLGVDLTHSLNLLSPSTQEVGWPMDRARGVARRLWDRVRDYDLVWLVGKNPATAFGLTSCELLYLYALPQGPGGKVQGEFLAGTIRTPPRPVLGVLPHPSGLNRWWNDDWQIEIARDFVRETGSWIEASRNRVHEEAIS